eukprot:COSAG01_NODE_5347_length_4319_cov_122.319431_3_plen_89_part_00
MHALMPLPLGQMATRQQIALAMKKLDDPITKVELSEMQDRYGELDHADTDERMVSREGFISFVTDRYRRRYALHTSCIRWHTLPAHTI